MDFFVWRTYNIIMIDLQSVFYIVAIIFMVLSIALVVGAGIAMYLVYRAVMDIRRKVDEKMKYVDRVIQHPEDVIAEIGASLIRKSAQRVRNIFKRGNTTTV